MDVMEGLEPEIGQRELVAARDAREHVRIDVAGRIDRHPARSDDVARPEDGGRKAGPPRLVEKPGLDGGLVRAVVAEGVQRIVLGRRHRGIVAVDPDGSAMEEMLDLARAGPRRDALRAGQVERDHVHDDVGSRAAIRPPKVPLRPRRLRSAVTCSTAVQAGSDRYGAACPRLTLTTSCRARRGPERGRSPHGRCRQSPPPAPSFSPRLQEPPAAVRRPESPPLRPPAPSPACAATEKLHETYGKPTPRCPANRRAG